jgi:uncharacterized membrane protein
MLWQAFQLLLLTFIPFVELRLAIPLGLLGGSMNLPFGIVISGLSMHPLAVFFICVTANFMLAVIIYILLYKLDGALRKSPFGKRYSTFRDSSKARVEKFTKRYGAVGLALFIAIPFPGSGVYTGTLGAFVIGLDKKKFLIASAVGVTLAGIIVTAITLTGMHFF